jgi:hypothetical protein
LNGAFYINGIADWKKEILNTGGYTDPRGITKATDSHIVIRWIGWRARMYNINDDNAELGALQSILYNILSSNMLFDGFDDVFDVPFDEMLAYLTYHLTAGISWHIIYTVLDISVLVYYNLPAAIPGMIKSRVITQWLRNNTKLLFYRAKCYPNIIICDSFF